MKYINFILIIGIFLCYTEAGNALQQILLPDVETHNHHGTSAAMNHHENKQDNNKIDQYPKYSDSGDQHTIECCQSVILNTSSLNLKSITTFLYLPSFDATVPKLKKLSYNPYFSNQTKRKYRPPDIYLTNSTFLI